MPVISVGMSPVHTDYIVCAQVEHCTGELLSDGAQYAARNRAKTIEYLE